MPENENRIIKTIHQLNVLKRLSGHRSDIIDKYKKISVSRRTLFRWLSWLWLWPLIRWLRRFSAQKVIALATVVIAVSSISAIVVYHNDNKENTEAVEKGASATIGPHELIFDYKKTITKFFGEKNKPKSIKDFLKDKRMVDENSNDNNSTHGKVEIDKSKGMYLIRNVSKILEVTTIGEIITSYGLVAFGIYSHDPKKREKFFKTNKKKYIFKINFETDSKQQVFIPPYSTKPFNVSKITKKNHNKVFDTAYGSYCVVQDSFFTKEKESSKGGLAKWINAEIIKRKDGINDMLHNEAIGNLYFSFSVKVDET